jgi:hypothetical protein
MENNKNDLGLRKFKDYSDININLENMRSNNYTSMDNKIQVLPVVHRH